MNLFRVTQVDLQYDFNLLFERKKRLKPALTGEAVPKCRHYEVS
jgi:hypothetical protein